MSAVAHDYKQLLDKFLVGDVTALEFQRQYLARFKNEKRFLSEDLFQLLDCLFGDVDSFTNDSELLTSQPDFYLDEASLFDRVSQVSSRLSTLIEESGG